MKVAFYTIAKNESQHVERWYESCRDADYHLILDTGSTDNTVSLASKVGVSVYVQRFEPFRFDTARQTALNLLPPDIDYCVSMDMDEVIAPGWREKIELAHEQGATRPLHWLRLSGALQILRDRIHARHGYEWRDPIHEHVEPLGQEKRVVTDIVISHLPDYNKSRRNYLKMLKDAVKEDPSNARLNFFLYRELYLNKRNSLAEETLARLKTLPDYKDLDFIDVNGRPYLLKLPEHP